MADTRTEHLNLIKQDPEAVPDYLDDHSNLEILDEEVWKRGKAFNGQPVGEDGGFHIRNVPYAENLETSSSQSSDADFIIRTTGGDASLMDGDAWLTLIKGTMTHTGYVPQSITMTVTPMARPTPPEITAVLNKETFIAYVQTPGTYTITYTTSWSESPATYGITVSNDPVNGDSITVYWDGENDPVMTVDAVPRQAPESIAAVIDDSVFVAYVQQSGTTTLTYGTGWSADPALYGITVTGTPIAGDVITVVYVKEVRGTIIQSTPETFVSTGWNLYNHTAGYARVIKYSTEYNFKISGAYTALEFASTPSGTRTTITPVSGAFSIPSDGYIIVTGGNSTTTAIWMTWSDWVSGYNWDGSQQGDFAPYSETVIDFGTFMATNFPYGLMQVGTAQDEINFNIGIATSKVLRLAYNDTNLATAKASGRQYEYDENYIYLERETPVTYSVEVDGDYAAFDHGMEYFTGTAQAVYAQTLYGQNLKNKLERDVLTISQQTLTSSQQAQVRTNIGLGAAATYAVANNLTTSTSGNVLDAQQGKVLSDQIASKVWTPSTGETLLNYIINNVSRTTLPVTISKTDSGNVADVPFASVEFVVLISGSGRRLHVELKQYNMASGALASMYERDIFDNAWLQNDWVSITDKIGALNSNTAKFVSTMYNGVSLSDVGADLISKFTGSFTVGFSLLNATDGSPAGFYIAMRNNSLSSNIRYICTNKAGVTNLTSEEYDVTFVTNVTENFTGYEIKAQKAGNMVTINGKMKLLADVNANNGLLFTVPSALKPINVVRFLAFGATKGGVNAPFVNCDLRASDGGVYTHVGSGTFDANSTMDFSFSYAIV